MDRKIKSEDSFESLMDAVATLSVSEHHARLFLNKGFFGPVVAMISKPCQGDTR